MGILNVTPDSFSDGGAYFDPADAVRHALEMVRDGADILDIGAQSTRPGHAEVTPGEEWRRLEPVLNALKGKISVPVSVDTYFPSVARKALENGADIINDVSGKISGEMLRLVRETGAGWILMHTGGGTADMEGKYSEEITREVRRFFLDSIAECVENGIDRRQLCVDPGIGFGKSHQKNLTIIQNIDKIKIRDVPLLTALSRKRVIGKASGASDITDRLYANIAAHSAAIRGGTDIIRVHNVREEKIGAMMADSLFRQSQGIDSK